MRSIDVALADDGRRRLVVVECWNSIGDMGGAIRTSNRTQAEATDLTTLRWRLGDHATGLMWVVRATARNRALVARYPEVFAARFPGSSVAWVRVITHGEAPPPAPGLVWSSLDGTRIWPWRRRWTDEARRPRGPDPGRDPGRDPGGAQGDGAGGVAGGTHGGDGCVDGASGAGSRWLELGAGDGEFTLALADLLGASGDIVALDLDRWALETLADRVAGRFPETTIETVVGDLAADLPPGPFDGVLAANSLHFIERLAPVLAAIHACIRPGGRLVLVEYDAERGNPYVPHPISFARWGGLARGADFEEPHLLHRVPSRFLGSIYGAVTERR